MAATYKTIRGPSSRIERVSWTNERILSLIREYEKENVLWNGADMDYYNKEKRKHAIRRIAAKLQITDRDVVKKINNLRTYYCREITKIRKAKKQKTPFDGGRYVSKWTFFKCLDVFLHKQMMPKQKVVNIGLDGVAIEDDSDDSVTDYSSKNWNVGHDDMMDEEEGRRSYAGSDVPANKETSQSRREIYGVLNSEDDIPEDRDVDEDELFGKIVANGLRWIKNYQVKQLAKIKIQHILYKAQFGVSAQEHLLMDDDDSTLSSENEHADDDSDLAKVPVDGADENRPTESNRTVPKPPPIILSCQAEKTS